MPKDCARACYSVQKSCLAKVIFDCLSAQGLTSSVGSSTDATQGNVGAILSKSSTTSRSVIKKRFRSFIMQFEEVCETQIKQDVPDKEDADCTKNPIELFDSCRQSQRRSQSQQRACMEIPKHISTCSYVYLSTGELHGVCTVIRPLEYWTQLHKEMN
ncbi:hypothetical protein GUJ93_ZPchr0004g40525 [Zizania palustris]|uniref:Exocyst complex subunit Exo70 C-terminal domain-containing protein n=1 Tax=Zizania palustris TaxID=103762 RepID=A0A8J5SQ15_ZIZPA|nr:hypothetical protein GUJ93_ZPchr0004g40525 [Zizania palustris]